jgi:hypothetical protein
MGNGTGGLHSAGTSGRAGSVFSDGMAPDVARVYARMSSAAGVRNDVYSRGAREVLPAHVLGGTAIRALRIADKELSVRGETVEAVHRGSAGMGRDSADTGDKPDGAARTGQDVLSRKSAYCDGGDPQDPWAGFASIADLLLGNPITLPCGKTWKPRKVTPEQRERNAKKAKAYRKRHPERVKALRDARLAQPEVKAKKAACSKKWAEKNRELLAWRRMQRYYEKKGQSAK